MQDERAYFPEIELTQDDRVQLMQTISSPGQAVFNRIFKSVVDGYTTHLLNSPEGNRDVAYERLLMSKIAAQLFTELVKRINDEIETCRVVASQGRPQVPQDDTEKILNIGELASTFDDLDGDAAIDETIEEGL